MKNRYTRRAASAANLLTAAAVTLMLIGVSARAQDNSRFLEVPAWQGTFWVRLTRLQDNNLASNAARGTFTFDQREDRNLWLGRGEADWIVREAREGCIGRGGCTVTVVVGGGTAPLDFDSDLEINPWNGSYEFVAHPDADVMEVTYEVTLPGGFRFDDGGELGFPRLRHGSETSSGPASIHAAYAEGLSAHLDRPVRLPASGLTLCHRERRADGAEVGYKIWPLGEREPNCPDVDAGAPEIPAPADND